MRRQSSLLEMANKLDSMMSVMFNFLKTTYAASDDRSDRLFAALCDSFDRLLLPVYRSKYTQFLLFYAASLSRTHLDLFISRLIAAVADTARSDVVRGAAACYLGSLLARGAFIGDSVVICALQVMAEWLVEYAAEHRGAAELRFGLFIFLK
jgi:RNA polymerase I-specific transcription initiation factor RRN3